MQTIQQEMELDKDGIDFDDVNLTKILDKQSELVHGKGAAAK